MNGGFPCFRRDVAKHFDVTHDSQAARTALLHGQGATSLLQRHYTGGIAQYDLMGIRSGSGLSGDQRARLAAVRDYRE